jgi:hypothetical protein
MRQKVQTYIHKRKPKVKNKNKIFGENKAKKSLKEKIKE